MKLRSDFLTSLCPAERTQFQLPQQSQSHRTLCVIFNQTSAKMKLSFLTFLILILSCKTEPRNSTSKKHIENNENEKEFFVGDINNDKIGDTAFVSRKENFEMRIRFSKNIPEIKFESLGCVILKVNDLNSDKSSEILIFSRTHEGWWNEISVLTFKNKKWEEIAKSKGFISDDKDFENRIIKEKGNYYLIGEDQWNEDEKGEFLKTKVKIKTNA